MLHSNTIVVKSQLKLCHCFTNSISHIRIFLDICYLYYSSWFIAILKYFLKSCGEIIVTILIYLHSVSKTKYFLRSNTGETKTITNYFKLVLLLNSEIQIGFVFTKLIWPVDTILECVCCKPCMLLRHIFHDLIKENMKR